MLKPVTIIAEIGVNHNGDIELAKKMILEAKKCGADIVKFQTAKLDKLVTRYAQKAEYQIENTGNDDSQFDMLKKLNLSYSDFSMLEEFCREQQIQFLSTPFDCDSIMFLNDFAMPFWKIPSGEITNYPYLLKIANTKKKVVMSTGMSSMDEIEQAVNVLKANGTQEIVLLQCNTQYPTEPEHVNLRAMNTLGERFNVEVGYSDHTRGIEISIAAVAMGATVIEKHFTLDKNMDGPDHRASIEPKEFKTMVDAIRNVERALGTSEKIVSESEKNNISVARKSIVAATNIKKGDIFSENNLTTKRPGNGISPMRWNEVIGCIADRDYEIDEMIVL